MVGFEKNLMKHVSFRFVSVVLASNVANVPTFRANGPIGEKYLSSVQIIMNLVLVLNDSNQDIIIVINKLVVHGDGPNKKVVVMEV
jgi:hypothetical protein